MAKYTLMPLYEGYDTITIETGDDGLVTKCSEGMEWVEMMTNRYENGKGHHQALMHAVQTTHVVQEDDGEDVSKDESEVDLDFEEVNKSEDRKQVFGWAYQSHDKDGRLIVDKSGEAIGSPEELEKAAYKFVLTSRKQGDMHRRVGADPHVAGTMIESMVFTPEKIEKMGLPPGSMPTGWWVGFQVSDESWDDVKSGRKQFSIHGTGKKRAAA